MLPDWPEAKDELGNTFLRFVQQEVQARLGFLSEVHQMVVHEGDGTAISRADGSSEDQEFTRLGAKMEIRDDEFAGLPIPSMLDKLRDVAEQLARQRTEHAFSVLDAAAESVGNVVNAAGGPLTAELILECWDTVEMVFDERGQVQLPTIVHGLGQDEALRRELARLAEDPELRQRAEGIIQRKRGEWFAREADRTLVG